MGSVLVVEDDADHRQLMVLALRRDGYFVIEAENGEQALLLFRQHPIDFVITDLFMPVMDGIELTRELRRISQSVKIVLMSGSTLSREPEPLLTIAQKFGADATIHKPFDITQLLAVTREAPPPGQIAITPKRPTA